MKAIYIILTIKRSPTNRIGVVGLLFCIGLTSGSLCVPMEVRPPFPQLLVFMGK